MILKHNAEATPIARHFARTNTAGGLTVDANLTATGSIEQKQEPQQGALTRPRVPREKGHFSSLEGQIQIAQGVLIAEATTDPLKFNHNCKALVIIQQSINKIPGAEISQIIGLLAHADKPYRTLQLMSDSE